MGMNPRLLRPTASGFDPRRIAGLALWLDAADASTIGNTSGGPGGISNNSPVRYWGDKSGGGRHATSSGADAAVPTYVSAGINGIPALSFDGSPDTLDGAWSLTLTGQTVVMVGTIRSGGTNGGRLWTQSDASGDASTSGHYIPLLRDGTNNAFSSYASTGFRAVVSVSLSTPLLMISRHTGSEIQNSLNNGASQTYGHTLNKTFTRYRMGADFASSGRHDGNIAEVLVYSRSVSDTERNALARYLGRKWGITVS
jgi:hypothetical protein